MAQQDADRGNVDEAEEAFRCFVVACCDAAGVLELVEAQLDQVPQQVERAVDGHAQLADTIGFGRRICRCLHQVVAVVAKDTRSRERADSRIWRTRSPDTPNRSPKASSVFGVSVT